MGKAFNFLKNILHPMGFLALGIAFAVPLVIYLLPKNVLRVLDLNVPLPLFCVQTVVGILLFAFLFKEFRDLLKKLWPKKVYGIGIILLALGMPFFASTQIEARHRVQSDESVFLSLAQNMFHNHISGTCNQGEFEQGKLQCHVNSNSFKTKGMSYLYFLGMGLLGGDLHWAFNAQLVCLGLSILLFFFALMAFTEHAPFSFLATVLLAVQPTVLFQFRSLSVEPLYILLFSLSLLLFKFAIEKNKWQHWVLLALVLAFFAQTRQETVFCLFAFVLFALPKLLDKKDKKFPLFIVALALFSTPVLLTISYYQNFNFQGGDFAAHGHFLEHVKQNWKVMTDGTLYGKLPRNPFLPYFSYLTLAGILVLLVASFVEIKNKKPGVSLLFLVFFDLLHVQSYVILENVSGDFTIEINQRYSLVMFPSFAIVAAFPFYLLSKFVAKKGFPKNFSEVLGLILAAVLILHTLSFKEAFNANIMYNRNHLTTEEVEIWKWLRTQDNLQDKLFIYARPYHFISYGLSSVHYDRIRQMSEGEIQALLDKYPNEVYYIRGLDCWDSKTYHKKAVEHRIPTTCDHFERDMAVMPIYNTLITNNYYVEISKFQGKRSFVQDQLLSHISTTENETGFNIEFKLLAKQKLPLEFKVSFASQEIYSAPYAYNESFEINVTKELKGYHLLEAQVLEPNGNILASYREYVLAKKDSLQLLSDITPLFHEQGWGNKFVNRSVDNNVLKIDGTEFPTGLGIHAPSKTIYELGKSYDSLSMYVGLDEEQLCSDGAKIKIFGDGNLLYEDFLNYKPIKSVYLSTKGIQQLVIETEPLSSMDCDHVDLVLPVLYKAQ